MNFWKDRSIRIRLTFLFLMIGFLAIVLTGIVSYSLSRSALEEESFNKLVAVREMKAIEISNYFSQIESQIRTFSEDRMVIQAMGDFSEAYRSYSREAKNTTTYKGRLRAYYENEYLKRLNANQEKNDIVGDLWPVSENARLLQDTFIAANPNQLGEKNKLNDPGDGSTYASVHRRFHPLFNRYLQEFGFYDIFLVDPASGNVVYTVFKEADFSTSLKEGPYRESGLARAFREGVQSKSADEVHLVDFAPYKASYGQPAAFISSPIYDGGSLIGILIFQLPVGKINEIMTAGGKWSTVGLGESGEMYMVGSDGYMRNNSRFLLEDPDGYFQAIKKTGMDEKSIKLIRSFNSSIGLQQIQTDSAKEALAGKTGEWIIHDYRDIPVLSAYRPLQIGGFRWGLISEIDESEAFAPVYSLRNWFLGISVALLALVAATGIYFSKTLVRPIQQMVHRIRDIAEGEGDLRRRLDDTAKDEMGELATWFNSFILKIHDIVVEIGHNGRDVLSSSGNLSESSTSLAATAEEMSNQSQNIASSAEQMNQSFQSISSAVEEMSQSIEEVARQASHADEIAKQADRAADEGEKVIGELTDNAGSIGHVIETIAGISEQINLLALNASIEAAGAGDAGKGFAVVASEVKELARQSSEALDDIRSKVERIQGSADNAVHTLSTISGIMREISEAISAIASAVEEQSITSREIAQNVSQTSRSSTDVAATIAGISQASKDVSNRSGQTSNLATSLENLARALNGIVGQFQVEGN